MMKLTIDDLAVAGDPEAQRAQARMLQVELAISCIRHQRSGPDTASLLRHEFEISTASAYRRIALARTILSDQHPARLRRAAA